MKKHGLEGFRVVVKEVEKLFRQFSRPNPKFRGMEGGVYRKDHSLTRAPLSFPAKEIFIQGSGDGSRYKLRAVILPQNRSKSPFDLENVILPIPKERLTERFSLSIVDKTIFILDRNGGWEFVIHATNHPIGAIEITVGPQTEEFNFISTPPKVISNKEAFKKDMNRFADIIETVLIGVYEKYNRAPPTMKLCIRPDMANFRSGESFPEVILREAKREEPKNVIERENYGISFKDIGGQKKGKKEIQGISFALKNPGLYREWGTKPPKGVLLFGPPGTGKTLMAKALATEAKANFYNIKLSEMTSKWYGESEKKMQAVFDLAKKSGPSIIFFDEIDAIASQRDSSHEATQRVVSTLLQNLDGMESAENIIVIASTNRLEAVDPAIKRPGRIDRLVEVPLPDEEGREHILKIHFAKAEKIAKRCLFNSIDVPAIVNLTKGMSGADLAEIIRRTLEEKVRQTGNGENPTLVSTKDILSEINEYESLRKAKQTIGFS